MAMQPYSPNAISQRPMGLVASIFFTPETSAQIRQKRITELRKLIPRLTIQVEAAKRVWKTALTALSKAYTEERTKFTSYNNQVLQCRLFCKQYRDIVLTTLPEDMCDQVNLTGPHHEKYDRKMDENLNLVLAQQKTLFPEGKNSPIELKRVYQTAYELALAKFNVQKTKTDGYESEYRQIKLELKKAHSELSRLESSIAQEAASTQVSELVEEFQQ